MIFLLKNFQVSIYSQFIFSGLIFFFFFPSIFSLIDEIPKASYQYNLELEEDKKNYSSFLEIETTSKLKTGLDPLEIEWNSSSKKIEKLKRTAQEIEEIPENKILKSTKKGFKEEKLDIESQLPTHEHSSINSFYPQNQVYPTTHYEIPNQYYQNQNQYQNQNYAQDQQYQYQYQYQNQIQNYYSNLMQPPYFNPYLSQLYPTYYPTPNQNTFFNHQTNNEDDFFPPDIPF